MALRPFRQEHDFNLDTIMFCKKVEKSSYGYGHKKSKKPQKSSTQKLFLLSQKNRASTFNNMPKSFILSTKNCSCHFNLEMLKETSPIISDFVRDNPTANQYFLNISDEENVLVKFEQLFDGETVIFDEDEIPSSQRITKILQIKNCPNFLKPKSLHSPEFDSEGNSVYKSDIKSSIEIYQNWLVNFLRRTEFRTFKIITKKKEYKCCFYGIYSSEVIRQLIEKDPKINQYSYDYEDEYNEFQSICDFFNFNQVDITSYNMDSLKEIAEDLQINCIIKQINHYINNYENFSKKIDEQQTIIDSIDNLFDLLININNYGIEKVKFSLLQSKWSKDEESVQELAAFIIQVIKPSFSLQKSIVELLIELNEEANETNKLNILIPFIIKNLMNFYMPQRYFPNEYLSLIASKETTLIKESTNLNNRCVYSFIRILYKKGLISKENIMEKLKNYNCQNKTLNIFFLPEIFEIDPKKIKSNQIVKNLCQDDTDLAFFMKKYLPDKIDQYEKMLDSMEIDDDLTKSLQYDDVDTLQKIITINGIDIKTAVVPYNIFDDFCEKITMINYAASRGSLKCFKYLLLNNGEIDEATLYFAVLGGNVEIIKIVDQKSPEYENDEKLQDIDDYTMFHYTKVKKQNLDAFWFNRVHLNDSFLTRSKTKTYSRLIGIKSKDNSNYICLNYPNANNVIASTIALHRNDLFDWIFEKKFVSKGKIGAELFNIAILSALSGNVHSMIEIIDKGFNTLSSDVIIKSSNEGFVKLTQLLLNIIGKNTELMKKNYSLIAKSCANFGNLSMLKLFINQTDINDFEQSIVTAVEMNHQNIINFYFDSLDKFEPPNKYFVQNLLSSSIRNKTDELFNFLMDKFQQISNGFFDLELYNELLNKACIYSNLSATKTLVKLILNINPKFNFSMAFIKASSSGSMDLCKYFIDQKVCIIYNQLSSQVSELGSVDQEIFEMIYNNVSPEIQYKFLKCIDYAIERKNIKLIDFLLKQNAPMRLSLFRAVESRDVEIVNLILKYNSKPSFINLKSSRGTALSIAVINNDIDIVKSLLSVPGINPSLFNLDNENALTIAIKNYNIDIFKCILDFYGDDINSNFTVFVKAFQTLNDCFFEKQTNKIVWKMVKRLLAIKSIDPNFGTMNTFFYQACLQNEIQIVEDFLKIENIDVNQYEINTYSTPLIIAIKRRHIEIVKILIKYPKTDINLRDSNDESPLLIAMKNNLVEVIDLLINDERFDPIENKLNYAFIKSNTNIAKQLTSLSFLDINQSFDIQYEKNSISTKQIKEITPLVYFVKMNDVDKIDMILNHPSFNKTKSNITKAIIVAAKTNNVNIFKKLIKVIDNDINIHNSKKINLLVIAAKNSSGEIIDEILNNPHFKPTNKEIIGAFVKSYSCPSQYLKNKKPNSQQTVLNQELIPNKSTVIEIMNKIYNYDQEHDHFIDFTQLIFNRKTYFTYILNNYDEITNVSQFLLDHGADPNTIDSKSENILAISIAMKWFDLFVSLINSNKIDFSQFVFERRYLNGDMSKIILVKTTYLHLAASIDDSRFLKIFLDKKLIDINITNEVDETPLINACQRRHIVNINLLFEKENLDFLHSDRNGKDALNYIRLLPPEEAEIARKNKENYHKKIISILNEENDAERKKILFNVR